MLRDVDPDSSLQPRTPYVRKDPRLSLLVMLASQSPPAPKLTNPYKPKPKSSVLQTLTPRRTQPESSSVLLKARNRNPVAITICIYIYIYTNKQTYIHAYIPPSIHPYIHTSIQYIHAYIHTYMCILYIYICK